MSTFCTLFSVFFPLVFGLASYFVKFPSKRSRNIFHLTIITLSAIAVWAAVFSGFHTGIDLLTFRENLVFTLKVDGAGSVFACMSSAMWVLSAAYATEYMKDEEHLTSFWMFFTASFGVTMGIAFAGNIMTMYLFYELLTICTIPLVFHRRKERDYKAATKYMLFSFGGAAFALSGVAFLIASNANSFQLGGSLSAPENRTFALLLFLFSFFGFGVKSAIFPLHSWLPTASVAPTPVTALLHSVAVVKAGAFAIIRLIYYSFGTSFLAGTFAQYTAMSIASFTIVYGSVQALRQRHFKRRLAYSTVSNLSYIVFAATVMTDTGLYGSLTHLVVHSVTKIAAFFVAGAVLHVNKVEYLDDMHGIGKKMPLSFACFTVSALSLTGIPGFAGFTSKWEIASAALENGSVFSYLGLAALLLSALLTAIYMFSVVISAFFPGNNRVSDAVAQAKEANAWMTVPMILCCILMILFGIFGGAWISFLKGVLSL